MAKKKRSASKKTSRAKKAAKRSAKPRRRTADVSRLDTGPLQDHIRKRIRDLESKRSAAAMTPPDDDRTLARLKEALEVLEDICHPSMTVPI